MYKNNFETFISKLKHEAKKQNTNFLESKVISVRLDNPEKTRIVYAGNIYRNLHKIPKEKYKDLQIIVCKNNVELQETYKNLRKEVL